MASGCAGAPALRVDSPTEWWPQGHRRRHSELPASEAEAALAWEGACHHLWHILSGMSDSEPFKEEWQDMRMRDTVGGHCRMIRPVTDNNQLLGPYQVPATHGPPEFSHGGPWGAGAVKPTFWAKKPRQEGGASSSLTQT